MSNIYLFKYNNFFNRLVKREEAIESYGVPLFVLENANFNPNNGVRTDHIINYTVLTSTPDYCVVTDEGGEIESRWYVMQCQRTRGLQYRLQLLRDVMAEYRDSILSATAFIEKGYLPQDNPLIFNNENIGFNQIKSGEYLLENAIRSPWLILYLSRYNGQGLYNSFSGNFRIENDVNNPDYMLEDITEYKYYHWANDDFYVMADEEDIIFGAEYMMNSIGQNGYVNKKKGTSQNIIRGINYSGAQTRTLRSIRAKYIGNYSGGAPSSSGASMPSFDELMESYESGTQVEFGLPINSYTGLGTASGLADLRAENGKKIKVGNKIYRIFVSEGNYDNYRPGFPSPDDRWYMDRAAIPWDSTLGNMMKKLYSTEGNRPPIFEISSTGNTDYELFILWKNRRAISIILTEIGSDHLFYHFSYDAAITADQPYEIIAAPLYDVNFQNVPGVSGDGLVKSFGTVARQWFQAIINKYNGEGAAYDLQILPYCPVDKLDLSQENVVFCSVGSETSTTYEALAIKLKRASFTQTIILNDIPLREDKKLSNEVDIYRLCSPNGVGEYEWSPAKNGGTVGEFEIDCTLIPFNPYIKINPVYYNLYGNDYNDFRGLICGGDFSMPILNSAWETYQLSNKYYQDIFNRDIAHQEFNNKLSRIQEGIGIATQTIGAGMQGYQSGGGAGAAVSALTSLAGGVADFAINESSRRENIQYQKDRFGYELGTIKARSQSLTRSSSLNYNNKYFPYIEYYTCTSVEVEAFKNKIKYNGMTIQVIGTVGEFLDPEAEWTYIQGEIIILDIMDDYQIVDEINRNLRGGIRIVYPEQY